MSSGLRLPCELRHTSPSHHQSIENESSDSRMMPDDSWVDVFPRELSSTIPSPIHDKNTASQGATSRDAYDQARSSPHKPELVQGRSNGAISSQEEYEETESEVDSSLKSSNENISNPIAPETTRGGVTARPPNDAFTPPANIFTHPPSLTVSTSTRVLDFEPLPLQPPRRPFSSARRQSDSLLPARLTRRNSSPYRARSAVSRVDHDAALRASLSTLLSCAAAARGLPKHSKTDLPCQHRDGGSSRPPTSFANQIRPSTLRLVTESEVLDTGRQARYQRPRHTPNAQFSSIMPPSLQTEMTRVKLPTHDSAISTSTSTQSPDSTSSRSPVNARSEKSFLESRTKGGNPFVAAQSLTNISSSTSSIEKRQLSGANKRPSKKRRSIPDVSLHQHTEAQTCSPDHDLDLSSSLPAPLNNVHPTIISWVVGAGVIVLFSALSFSAGYVFGRGCDLWDDAPGQFVPSIARPESGRGFYRGLRKLKWAGGSGGAGAGGGMMESAGGLFVGGLEGVSLMT